MWVKHFILKFSTSVLVSEGLMVVDRSRKLTDFKLSLVFNLFHIATHFAVQFNLTTLSKNFQSGITYVLQLLLHVIENRKD